MCTGPGTAGAVRAAVPHPAAGAAADPIALEPVDEVVVTTLVDNIYDALLTSDQAITRAPLKAGTARAPQFETGRTTVGLMASPGWHQGNQGAVMRWRRSARSGCPTVPSANFNDLGSVSPPRVAADPRSSMGPQLVPGPGSYSGCHITRSNSLPSGSANVVWRTAATPGGSASGGSLISVSGLAPRAVSRSISSS